MQIRGIVLIGLRTSVFAVSQLAQFEDARIVTPLTSRVTACTRERRRQQDTIHTTQPYMLHAHTVAPPGGTAVLSIRTF